MLRHNRTIFLLFFLKMCNMHFPIISYFSHSDAQKRKSNFIVLRVSFVVFYRFRVRIDRLFTVVFFREKKIIANGNIMIMFLNAKKPTSLLRIHRWFRETQFIRRELKIKIRKIIEFLWKFFLVVKTGNGY